MTDVINLITGERRQLLGYSPTTALYAARLIKQSVDPQILAMVPEGCIAQWRKRLDYGRLSMAFMDEFCIAGPDVDPGDRFRHYKGMEVEILDLSRHTETKELLVVYKETVEARRPTPDPYHRAVWSRPLGMFFEDVFLPTGITPRFTRLMKE